MPTTTLPTELLTALGSESQDFSVKAARKQPLSKSLFLLAFGTFWTLFSGMFAAIFISPVLLGGESHFTVNGVATVASADNMGALVAPGLFIGLFLLVGFAILGGGFYSLLAKGGYFVGTPTRLVNYRNGTLKSYDWEQFTGTIEVSGNERNGSISLELRTGKMVSQKNGPDRYVPDIIYIASIENAFEIERLCRRRIRENDPTPANVEVSAAV